MIRVLLVDDEELVRFGLRTVLEAAGDFTVVGEAGNGADGVAAARGTAAGRRPDGHPHAGDGRADRDQADPRAARSAAGRRPHDLPRRRVRVRGAGRGRRRLPAQGHPAARDRRRGARGRRRHGDAVPGRHGDADRVLRRPEGRPAPGEALRRVDGLVGPRARGARAARQRRVERRTGEAAVRQRGDGEDLRLPAADQARPRQPHAGRDPRPRGRPARRLRRGTVSPARRTRRGRRPRCGPSRGCRAPSCSSCS